MSNVRKWRTAGYAAVVALGVVTAGVSAVAGRESQGQGAAHRADPCEKVPDDRGQASAHHQCAAFGSSGGVARGDFNGDGIADLAVGSPGEDIGAIQDAGSVTVIYGSANGLSATAPIASQLWHQDSTGIVDTNEPGDAFGSGLASGDFNGDMFADLAISAPGDNAVHWIFGSNAGLVSTNNQRTSGTNFVNAAGNPLTFQDGLVWGDFDNDTFGDLAIEARGPDAATASFIGHVVVLYGSNQSFGLRFLSTRPPFSFPNSASGNSDSGFIAGEVQLTLSAGDFDGDLDDDLAVGVPFADVQTSAGPAFDAGGVFVLRGSPASGLTTAGLTSLTQAFTGDPVEVNDRFGAALASGNFNGLGGDDLAVGVPFEDRGTVGDEGMVHVFLDAITFHSNWTQSLLGQPRNPGDHFGAALAAGDFNGDGSRDLAIGVPGDELPGADQAGSVTIIYGGATGIATTNGPGVQFLTQVIVSGVNGENEQGDRFGAVLTAWNFGRTGQADLAIGVPEEDIVVSLGGTLEGGITLENRVNAGNVRVVYGSTTGLTTTGAQTWSQNSTGIPDSVEAGDRFGASVY